MQETAAAAPVFSEFFLEGKKNKVEEERRTVRENLGEMLFWLTASLAEI